MYTTQVDRHGNLIVCKGSVERNGYQAIHWGTYNECLLRKATYSVPSYEQPSRWHTRANGQPLDTEE
jgi:hypothetical protein